MSLRDRIADKIMEHMSCLPTENNLLRAKNSADEIIAIIEEEQGEVVGWENVYRDDDGYETGITQPTQAEALANIDDSENYVATVPIRLPKSGEGEKPEYWCDHCYSEVTDVHSVKDEMLCDVCYWPVAKLSEKPEEPDRQTESAEALASCGIVEEGEAKPREDRICVCGHVQSLHCWDSLTSMNPQECGKCSCTKFEEERKPQEAEANTTFVPCSVNDPIKEAAQWALETIERLEGELIAEQSRHQRELMDEDLMARYEHKIEQLERDLADRKAMGEEVAKDRDEWREKARNAEHIIEMYRREFEQAKLELSMLRATLNSPGLVASLVGGAPHGCLLSLHSAAQKC
jgi:hypothetical protein